MFERITINPYQMNGEPCIRNLRIPVTTILTMLAQGISFKDILKLYPDLEQADIDESLLFAAESLRIKDIPLTKAT
jgi:uncharacterized protein (DUF433 family)